MRWKPLERVIKVDFCKAFDSFLDKWLFIHSTLSQVQDWSSSFGRERKSSTMRYTRICNVSLIKASQPKVSLTSNAMKTVGKNDSGRLLQCFSQFRQQMTIHSFNSLASSRLKTKKRNRIRWSEMIQLIMMSNEQLLTNNAHASSCYYNKSKLHYSSNEHLSVSYFWLLLPGDTFTMKSHKFSPCAIEIETDK